MKEEEEGEEGKNEARNQFKLLVFMRTLRELKFDNQIDLDLIPILFPL